MMTERILSAENLIEQLSKEEERSRMEAEFADTDDGFAFHDGERSAYRTMKRLVECGQLDADRPECPKCGGTGMVKLDYGYQGFEITCDCRPYLPQIYCGAPETSND